MFKAITVSALTVLLLGGAYTYTSVYGQDKKDVQVSNQQVGTPVPAATVKIQDSQQQPAQPPQEETDKHCERPNPDGTNPDVGGVHKDRLGCTCMRKCENGKPTENYEDGKRCKVHCKPDHCHCPNPCKT